MNCKIRLEPSGREFTVQDGETILDAALREGVGLAYSCRNGSCGSCKGSVRAGTVDYGTYDEAVLTAAERAAGKALFCQARPTSDLVVQARELVGVEDIAIKTLPARVVSMERAAHDVMILRLKLPQTERLRFLAGQYLDVLLRGGERRSFSLANAPHEDELLELHVRRVPQGKFTSQVFETMKEKDLLRFRGPLGTFFVREDSDRPLLFVAGGTGFAPIQGMLAHAFAGGVTRPMHLFWGVRAQRDLYRDARIREWVLTHPGFRYTPVLSDPAPEDRWSGRTGWVHEAVVADYPDLSGFDVYASGPPPMIAALRQATRAHGLPEDRLFYDSFEFAHATA
jgi:CDP-4-dehydro-6-deoxyglucose reductase